MLFLTSKTICDYMAEGIPYEDVRKVYSVNIVYFDLGTGEDYIYHGKTHFTGFHQHDELKLSPSQRETFSKQLAGDIFPEYYILKVNRFDDIAKDTLDEWIYYLKNSRIQDGFHAQGLQRAQEVLNKSCLSEEERREYEKAVDIRRSNDSTVKSAKIEGKIEGRMEEKIDMIRESYNAGIPVETIASISRLAPEEVKAILNIG